MVKIDQAAKDESMHGNAVRRPYTVPRLTYLGTVYELTLTGSGSSTEGFSVPKPRAG